ncbi:hypothetical protein COW36_07270 [bacterium (Candidatus Blackallbacteria) CG17_big_fil_post_rev_8_21_14_2_50_48_46]|uniref:Uncharacterized protein n=1 Tax=bacterium (Candidatus Blackallbacteria) CG17_big_fil_post_rev_8_21_14_2_50_48_46 TaxID=2014261 RepID=A0A2M7G729_9BACT|nr:MAG: hypothetical protein COW64_06780 [bacterium (Candidatus Blackallbacteria) CG18_big_fil_WC_8_21_14_2_50_49_26]PIW17862.1 MAG: hypothetical protein COW36_07270 [bacterium (Candidatus Blackallbacteria) CG17_big_fil_post_rev_8_21_14_2_50_48_46]PIW48538.1 MAG: hypothetical protein COW20_09225 [bacterium (Candidatus Blackallbacteria) CG13_big_fil_rev_8_21_14_2_50_49_14]
MKKLLAWGVAASCLLACQTGPVPTALQSVPTGSFNAAEVLVAKLKAQGQENITLVDLGQGRKTGASFSMTLNFKDAPGFATQASTSGVPSGAGLNQLRVYLLESAAAPGAGDISALVKNTGGTAVARSGVGAQTFVFANVPANTAGKKYWVGVSAELNITTGPAPAPYTLNLVATPNTHFEGTSAKLVAVSSAGGEGAGQVFVDANYQVSNTTALSLSMTLKNETGATIDSAVTVNNGTTGIGAISAS